MRKFGIKYSRLHPQGRAVRDAFIAVRRPGQWLAVLEGWYAEDLRGRYPTFDEELGEDCAEAA
jgi:tRNA-dihydrouridine synthase B